MQNSEKPAKSKRGGAKFEVAHLPRSERKDVSPAGITYSKKRSIKDLPPSAQNEVKAGHVSLEDAWSSHFEALEDAYSTPFNNSIKNKIIDSVSRIENQNTHSKHVFEN